MSTLIDSLGWWHADDKVSTRPQKVVLAKPGAGGGSIVIIPEWNDADPFAQNIAYGDGSGTHRLKVYEIDASGNGTLRVNTNITNWVMRMEAFSADMYADGSIGLVYVRADNGNLCFRKITPAWAVGAQEVVHTITGTEIVRQADICITADEIPVVSAIVMSGTNPKCTLKLRGRGTGGTWGTELTVNLLTTADPDVPMASTSIVGLTSGSSAARPIVIGATSAQDSGTDNGFEVWTTVVAATTGALSTPTKRKTYLAGNMETKFENMPRRAYLFPHSDGSSVFCVLMEATGKKNILVSRITWNGTTFAEPMPAQTTTIGSTAILAARHAASYANGTINFYYIIDQSGQQILINHIARIDTVANTVGYSGPYRFDNSESNPNRWYPMAGTGRYGYTVDGHKMVYFNRNSNDLFQLRFVYNIVPPAPTLMSPSGVLGSGMPEVSVRATLNKQWPQSRHKVEWQFAKNTTFTDTLISYIQPDAKYVKVENTQAAGTYVYIADTLPPEKALTSGTWYVRARLIDEFGKSGAFSATNTVSLSHPPSAINLSPSGGQSLADSAVQFSWGFSDPLATDSQSAYQIIVEKVSDGAVVYDTGKVVSTAGTHLNSFASTLNGMMLRWKIRLWDTDDAPGDYSPYQTFIIASAPTVVINSPTNGSTVTGGTPAILFTPTVATGRRIVGYEVTVLQSATVLKFSGRVSVDSTSGVQLSWRVPEPILENGDYSVAVTVFDETGMSGTSSTVTFTVNATPAPTPTGMSVDDSSYNTENQGYVLVTWADTARSANWVAWVVERKGDLLVGNTTTVAEEGDWEIAGRVEVASSIGYSFKDYYAPSGYRVQYRVRQLISVSGNQSYSTGEPVVSIFPQSEGYWIIQPVSEDGATLSFRLHNVTADSYVDEYDESEYIIIGRGRHVDRGDFLGVKGTLEAQLRDTENTSARQKLLRLKDARSAGTEVYIRNPFGDVTTCHLSNINVTRIAGVGVSEFVDVSIPYIEVDS